MEPIPGNNPGGGTTEPWVLGFIDAQDRAFVVPAMFTKFSIPGQLFPLLNPEQGLKNASDA
jgi:hypothetical protein